MSSTSVTTDPASARQPLDRSLGSSQEVARANLYHFLARSFSSPLEMEDGYPEQLRLVIPGLDPSLQTPGITLARAWEDALRDREALSLAYARLFLGPFLILAPPYASFYLEPDHKLMGEVSQKVARMYAAAGLGPGQGPDEAPDHVALEWEFMYYLTYQYITSNEERWIEQREEFRSTHLNHWMPSLAKAMAGSVEHPFYHALSKLLTTLLEESGLHQPNKRSWQ